MTTLLRGTMLTPGVSANRRLYTPEIIQKAYARLSERLKDPTRPATMLTHHEAGDNSVHIVGRITGVQMNNGNLDYTAQLAETPEAQTIAALVKPEDGSAPFLTGVSIRGWWLGNAYTKVVEGQQVTTADDMEIDGLDFTKTPGVTGAYVAAVDNSTTETTAGRVAIAESVEARAVFAEAVNTKPYGSVRYADPGYLADKVKRYPLDTKKHAKAAWSYINQADNAKQYTAAQLKRIRARIKSALQKFGVDVTTEAATMPAPLTEAATTLSECYSCVQDGTGTAGFSISAYNGPLTVTVSAYNGVEPADLPDIAMAAMQAACDAITAMDPDNDGDIDTGASESKEQDDTQMQETAPASETVKESAMGDTTPAATPVEAPAPVEENAAPATPEAPAPVEEATETPAVVDESAPVTRADLKAAVAEAVSAVLNPPQQPVEAAPEEKTEEAAPSVEELRETIRQEVIAEAVASGVITRKGLVENADAPEKPLHEMSEEEFRAYQARMSELFFSHNQ